MKLHHDLFLDADVLRTRRNSKWRRFAEPVMPAWIADMDLKVADVIQEAIDATSLERDYGYPRRSAIPAERIAAEAWVKWVERRHGWTVDVADVVIATDVMQACVAAILSFSAEGDGVLLPTPCYPPFRSCIIGTKRRLIDCPMVNGADGFSFDFDAMEAAIDDSTRMILLCNPQNPTGRAMTRDELEAVVRLAHKYNLVVFVDEIHSDLVYEGNKHIALANLSPEAAALTVTATSATKAFSIPALRLAVLHFGSKDLRSRFDEAIPGYLLGKPAIQAIDAATAAWTGGDAWLDDAIVYLTNARDKVFETVQQTAGLSMHLPQSTYLAFIDCRELNLDRPAAAHFLDKAKIGLSEGESFAADYGGWIRLNFATSPEILDEILARLTMACQV